MLIRQLYCGQRTNLAILVMHWQSVICCKHIGEAISCHLANASIAVEKVTKRLIINQRIRGVTLAKNTTVVLTMLLLWP